MASYLNLDDTESLREKIDEKAPDLFKSKPGKPQLQVNRLFRTRDGEGKETIRFKENQDVGDSSQLEALKHEPNDLSQIFVIRQDRSWTTVNISQEMFKSFLEVYNVFSQFWKFLFTFGRKCEENEFEFPGYRARRTPPSNSNFGEVYESAYILRRAEQNHRELTEGQSPWSIRQTAVYHKFNPNSDTQKPSLAHSSPPFQGCKSTFLLVAPSKSLEGQLSHSFKQGSSNERAIAPWNIHRLLVAESLRGWMEYTAWLEAQLRDRSDPIVFTRDGDFNDLQILRLLEDYIIDLQVILSTALRTIIGIRKQCKECHKRHCRKAEKCDCDQIIEEFDEHVNEAGMHVQRAESLRERAKSTVQLLSALLSYEENKSMHQLAESSARDAAAVKVLTIISLVYLPTTIVANFFSTQFVHTGNSGNMQVSANAWLLAAIAVPLTIITIATWWFLVHRTNFALPNAPQQPEPSKAQHRNSIRSLFSLKEKQRPNDEEKAMVSPSSTLYDPATSPRSFCNSGVGSWSTMGSRAKSEKR